MGGGAWSRKDFVSYSSLTKGGATVDHSTGYLRTTMSNQEMFKSRKLDDALNPYNVIRECVDSEEHPNTIPVILALDVTGSMGDAAVEVAKRLNAIITKLYDEVKDIEFMIMGIGDLAYDDSPIQASQFESDIRIAEQLDKVYFEFGGGGNSFESYTAAWYFGSRHCKLDCWNRGKKGIIITIGDERLNPHLPMSGLIHSVGDKELQGDVETDALYEEASKKFDIYHLDIDHGRRYDGEGIDRSWKAVLGQHYIQSNLNKIDSDIVDIILKSVNQEILYPVDENGNAVTLGIQRNEAGEITW